ncbi:hypothetical protein EOM09_06850 [bacterium]|nr:hypothetical protein [bacterium]
MNFENINQRPLSLIDKNAEKIVKEKEEYRILEDSFHDIYEDSEIESDKKYVLEMKKKFRENETRESEKTKTIANAIEIIINDQIELADWLGEETYTYQTSEYDDIRNGIDAVLEFINEDEENNQTFLGIAFDITYKNDVAKKFLRIKKEIDEHKNKGIKYFQSENTDYKGPIENIPRLVIGLDIKSGEELIELYCENRNKELSKHFFQFELIDELLYQLDIFIKYSEKVKNKEALTSYEEIKEKILKIKKEKESLKTEDRDYRNSYFYNFCGICEDIFIE